MLPRRLPFAALLAALLLGVSRPALAAPPVITAADGATVAAQTSGGGEFGLVIVAAPDSKPASWDAVRTRLGSLGARVVTVTPRALAPVAEGETLAAQDVAAAVAWLRKQKVSSVTILGSREGGNLALHAAATDPGISRIVVVSPRLSADGLSIASDLKALADRPLLLVTSAGDTTGTRAAAMIASKESGAAPVKTLTVEGVGSELFAKDPKLDGEVLTWLRGPAADPTRSTAKPTAGEVGTLETTGTKYGN